MKYRYTVMALSELLTVTRDSARSFDACVRGATLECHRTLFRALREHTDASSAELQTLIDSLGGDCDLRGSLLGTRRGWVQSATVGDDDAALLEECEHAEGRALEAYRNALDDHLPEEVRSIVLRQFEELMQDQDQIRIVRSEPRGVGSIGASLGEHAGQ